MRFLIERFAGRDGQWRRREILMVVISTAVILVFLHLLEITLWALTYMNLPSVTELGSLEEALYFSLVTFTTLGYGDVTLGPVWRLLSGMEAMNGILLAGWATAFFFLVLRRSVMVRYGQQRQGPP